MKRSQKADCRAVLAMIALLGGCAWPGGAGQALPMPSQNRISSTDPPPHHRTFAENRAVSQVAYQKPAGEADSPQPADLAGDPADPLLGETELALDLLVAEVQARNPSI